MKKTKPPRLGAKWLQLDEYSEKIKNSQGLKTVEDEDYYFEDDFIDKVANFNFSRSTASYIGK